MKIIYTLVPLFFLSLFACQKEKHPPFSQLPIYQENIAGFEALEDSLRAICQNPKGQMGIYVYDAQLDKSFSIAGDTLFPLASVYKLPIVASLLAAQEAGKLSLFDSIRLDLEDRRHSGCFMDWDTTGKTNFTPKIEDLALYMMRYSDNCATDALLRQLGGPEFVQAQLKSWRVSDININRYLIEIFIDLANRELPEDQSLWTYSRATQILSTSPWSERKIARRKFLWDRRDQGSPKAFVQLLKGLDQEHWLNANSSQWLRDCLLSCQTGRYFLPKVLPPNRQVAHKTGSLPGIYNDAGWIEREAGQRPIYYAVFLKNAFDKPKKERARIAAAMKQLLAFQALPKTALVFN